MLRGVVKVAIVYDRLNKWGGAERVLLALHKIFPEAPLFTSVYHKKKASWAKVFPGIYPSFVDKLNFLRDKHELIPFLMPIAFEHFDFSGFDLIISVTSESAKGILVKPPTQHICYCLSPTRYLWSGYDNYFENPFARKITKPIVNYLRSWDVKASARPDIYVAISNEVKRRIKKYYKRDSKVIFPPVDPKFILTNDLNFKRKGKYFLVVSRLVPYKKVDLVVETFNELGWPLIVVGTGSEERKLRSKARGNIKFLGSVSESRLKDIYKNAKAFVFPQEEDFGLVAVEALGAGVPVVAYKKGGSLDIVENGKTGVFFESQTKDSLKNALDSFDRFKFNYKTLVKSTERFSTKRFENEFEKLLKNL